MNWNDPKEKLGKYFTVKEATLLPSWGICHIPSEEEQTNIIAMAEVMNKIREMLGKPINVHCWIRPGSVNNPGHEKHGQDYNAFVKGAKNSSHKIGRAVDFSCSGMTCDEIRTILEQHMECLGICIEDLPGSNWVHVDINPPRGGKRLFKP